MALVSDSHRFIFVHVYKVAGTSIRSALRPYAWSPSLPRKVLKALGVARSAGKYDFPGHISASALKERLSPVIFDEYFKFAFVRNPWDWQVSLYHFARQSPDHHQHELIKGMSFPEYIDWRVHQDLHLQSSFLTDSNGRLLVDFVGRMEQLQRDFATVCNRLGLEAALPRKNVSVHSRYREYYDDKTMRLVENYFHEDIELFGYSYE